MATAFDQRQHGHEPTPELISFLTCREAMDDNKAIRTLNTSTSHNTKALLHIQDILANTEGAEQSESLLQSGQGSYCNLQTILIHFEVCLWQTYPGGCNC